VDIHFIDLLIDAVFGQLLKLSVERNTGVVWFELKVYVDMLIYLLTAIGLTPGGRSTVHTYTLYLRYIHAIFVCIHIYVLLLLIIIIDVM
jgi:hypothetical protein